MKKFLWLALGAALGFVAAHQFAQTSAGKQFFNNVDARTRDFGKAVTDSYKAREAELRRAINN